MRITGLEPQKRKPDHYALFLDGRFAVTVKAEDVAEFGLATGRELSQAELDWLLFAVQVRRARDYALLLLSYRARTQAELEQRLRRKGFTPPVCEAVLKRLSELMLVDDERFAQGFAEDRISIGHKGKWRVRAELIKRGVGQETIERALAQSPDETGAAREVVERYAKRYAGLAEPVRRRRLYALLARRGFGAETIREVLGDETAREMLE